MNKRKNSKNTRLWPLGITLLFCSFVALIIGLIAFASSQDFSLVERDYYQKTLKYQQHIDQVSRSQTLDQQLTIELSMDKNSLSLIFPEDFTPARINGTVLLYRPSDPRLDRNIIINISNGNSQHIPVGALPRGLWYVKVDWQYGEDVYFDEQKVVLK